MPDDYYKPCAELTRCNELIERYWNAGDYEACFQGHLELAKQGYPLAECQVGYFYLNGFGVAVDPEQGVLWTRRAAEHGDRDAQFNLGCCYEEGLGVAKDPKEAERWYRRAAAQGQREAIEKCAGRGS